jgi:hypothetical protein
VLQLFSSLMSTEAGQASGVSSHVSLTVDIPYFDMGIYMIQNRTDY